jgi:hypothetical protein
MGGLPLLIIFMVDGFLYKNQMVFRGGGGHQQSSYASSWLLCPQNLIKHFIHLDGLYKKGCFEQK